MNTHHIAYWKEIVAQHSPRIRIRSGKHRVDTLIAVIRNDGRSCGGKKKHEIASYMINAIINNNETIPSQVCAKISEGLYRYATGDPFPKNKRIDEFLVKYFARLTLDRFSCDIDFRNFCADHFAVARDCSRKDR